MQMIHARYGPLRLAIWVKNGSGRLPTTVYDTRYRRNVYRLIIEGTVEEAQQQALTVAQQKLGGVELCVEWTMLRYSHVVRAEQAEVRP